MSPKQKLLTLKSKTLKNLGVKKYDYAKTTKYNFDYNRSTEI